MRTQNAKRIDSDERTHMARVKMLPCGVCGSGPPCDAHHMIQGYHYLTLPLCGHCHTGQQGIHGDKTLWRVRKLDELRVLNETYRRLQSSAE